MLGYYTTGPTQHLANTGCGIRNIKLAKKAFIWPLQKCIRFDVIPVDYNFQVEAMSSEKLPFILPIVFTMGPMVEEENLILYARLLSAHDKNSNMSKISFRPSLKAKPVFWLLP